MIKPGSLRAFLTAAIPELQKDPDRLQVYIERGRVRSTGGDPECDAPRAWEYKYTLKLLITDFAAHPDALFAPLVNWVGANQPEIFQPDAPGFGFEVEILSHDLTDVEIELDLSEPVVPKKRQDGGWDLDHPIWSPIDKACCSDGPLQIFFEGELIASWTSAA